MEDLGLIEWSVAKTPARTKLHPYRLPSKASAVIVKYRPRVAISCVIPPQRFEVSYRIGSRSSGRRDTEAVATPILLMTQTIAEMPSSARIHGVIEGYSLWALQLEEGGLSKTKKMRTSPYLFGNVWDKGVICFGGMTPQSLMQAFNYYWSSGFNDELFRDQGHHVCNSKDHRYGSSHVGCRCGRQFEHQCSCSRKTSHQHHYCGCRTVVASRKCKGSCIRRVIIENPELKDLYNIVMLTFSMQGFPFGESGHGIGARGSGLHLSASEISEASEAVWNHWQLSVEEVSKSRNTRAARSSLLSGGYCICCLSISTQLDKAKRKSRLEGKSLGPRKLSSHTVTDNEPYPGCGCGWRHKNTCACSASRCQCPCVCECCLKTCGHPVCTCTCCRGECNCNCNCSSAVKFKEHLQVYHEKILPEQPWKDRTTLICGEAYWASPQTSSVVLVTNHPYVLMNIPQKFRRKMYSGEGIIALGKEDGDCWEFDSGTYKFRVPSSLVTAN